MLYPSIFSENLMENLMDMSWPTFPNLIDVDRKLYGKHASRVMKTDVHEHDDEYEMDIDLPGFKKDEITVNLDNGYLNVRASRDLNRDQKAKNGRIIRQERYTGSMQRSFYVGDKVKDEDVKAKFEDGVLKLNVQKKEAEALPEKKTILIEG